MQANLNITIRIAVLIVPGVVTPLRRPASNRIFGLEIVFVD
jgi:hypothetical protein